MALIGTDLELAAGLLRRGEIIGIPTETVYGLAGNATSPEAVTKIFLAKERPSFDPLIVHVHRREGLEEYSLDFPEIANDLIEKFWPGPLTLLLNRTSQIPDLVTSGLMRAGFRCPNHPLTLELLRELDFPLAAPSANPFGYVSPTSAQHVEAQLGSRIPYILDGGPCKVGLESTIVGFMDDEVVVYRLGGISMEEIKKVTGRLRLELNRSSNPTAPGQLSSHYAPKKKLRTGNLKTLIEHATKEGKTFSILGFRESVASEGALKTLLLSPAGDLSEAARNLFGYMRELDRTAADVILAAEVPDEGLGAAINDRLRRAAH